MLADAYGPEPSTEELSTEEPSTEEPLTEEPATDVTSKDDSIIELLTQFILECNRRGVEVSEKHLVCLITAASLVSYALVASRMHAPLHGALEPSRSAYMHS